MSSIAESKKFSDDEERVIRTLFDSCDEERIGRIHINQLSGLLTKLGKSDGEIVEIIEQCSKYAEETDGLVAYDDLLFVLQSTDNHTLSVTEGPDPKVVEFMRILEEYRVKCEEEGNYLEAGRSHKQLQILRTQEEKKTTEGY